MPSRGGRADDAIDKPTHAERRDDRTGKVQSPAAARLAAKQTLSGDEEGHADGNVDQEADAPGNPTREYAAKHQPQARPDAGRGCVSGKGAVTLLAFSEMDGEQ